MDTAIPAIVLSYPTDSSLLWDVYRTIERLISQARDAGALMTATRFHLKKIKKLHLNVTRFSKSKNKKRQRWVKSELKLLIDRVNDAVIKAERVNLELSMSTNLFIQGIGITLGRFVPTMQRIVNVAARNWNGESVPIEDKVFSLFESHTELIMQLYQFTDHGGRQVGLRFDLTVPLARR
jgi:hypothetical protein